MLAEIEESVLGEDTKIENGNVQEMDLKGVGTLSWELHKLKAGESTYISIISFQDEWS